MTVMSTSEARDNFKDVVEKAGGGDRIAIKRHGKIVAGIVSADDLKFLRYLEDRYDRRVAREAKAEAEQHGGTRPAEEFFAELGF